MNVEQLYTLISERLVIGELNLFNKRFGTPSGLFVMSMLKGSLKTISIHYDDIDKEIDYEDYYSCCVGWMHEEFVEPWI